MWSDCVGLETKLDMRYEEEWRIEIRREDKDRECGGLEESREERGQEGDGGSRCRCQL